MANENQYFATVEKIINQGERGPYAVSRCKEIQGTVTFYLRKPVWMEESIPKPGVVVVLIKLRRHGAGWRAEGARYMAPEDETSRLERSN